MSCLSSKVMLEVCKNGKLIFPGTTDIVLEFQGCPLYGNASVCCDRCNKGHLPACFSYTSPERHYDLCLNCVKLTCLMNPGYDKENVRAQCKQNIKRLAIGIDTGVKLNDPNYSTLVQEKIDNSAKQILVTKETMDEITALSR